MHWLPETGSAEDRNFKGASIKDLEVSFQIPGFPEVTCGTGSPDTVQCSFCLSYLLVYGSYYKEK